LDDGDDLMVEEEFHDDIVDDPQAALANKNALSGYSVRSLEEIQETIDKLITDVSESLNVSMGDAVVLLRHFKWDMNKLSDEWWQDPDSVARKAGVVKKAKKSQRSKDVSCPVCLDDINPKKAFSLSCGHAQCNECWTGYLQDSLGDGTNCVNLKCPTRNCKASCTPEVWKKFLPHKSYLRYLKFNVEAYVETNERRKWCPAPGCTNCIETSTTKHLTPIKCHCGFSWCFFCHDHDIGSHAPASCDEVAAWLKKSNAESENIKWMTANCKLCPKCDKHIEKNGGCMHMTCQRAAGGCGHEFCWLCRSPWNSHRECNKSEKVIREEKNAKRAANELQKYMNYFHRYESHKNAMKIADEQRKNCEVKAHALMDYFNSLTTQETKFLYDATEQLIDNRRMLCWSYVMAYYMNQKRVKRTEIELFKYLQNDLEHHTDKLSELYEKSLEDTILNSHYTEWKTQVSNYTSVCHKFLQNFIDGVVNKKLTCEDGDIMSDDARYYSSQIEMLEAMGFDSALTLPLLKKYDGDVERVTNFLLS